MPCLDRADMQELVSSSLGTALASRLLCKANEHYGMRCERLRLALIYTAPRAATVKVVRVQCAGLQILQA